MAHPVIDISNLDLPIAQVLRDKLREMLMHEKKVLLAGLDEDTFISQRVDIYLNALEDAMHAGYDELGAREIALTECIHGITGSDGEVLEA
ncbi:MAG: hypothetical protein JNM57_10860 [Cyclobacteriaceae bacterium]|nr:hypothetical protein [Cyclobacteriaceae bacterium]